MTALITINGEVYELTRVEGDGIEIVLTLVPFVGEPIRIWLNYGSSAMLANHIRGMD